MFKFINGRVTIQDHISTRFGEPERQSYFKIEKVLHFFILRMKKICENGYIKNLIHIRQTVVPNPYLIPNPEMTANFRSLQPLVLPTFAYFASSETGT